LPSRLTHEEQQKEIPLSGNLNIKTEADLIWNTADDILRDVFTRTQYPDIIYPMVLIRRID